MKRICLLLTLMLLCICQSNPIMAQEENADDNTLYTAVDEAPAFNGGMVGISQFVGTNLKYPKQARKNNVTGDVVAQFVIEKDGSISDINIVTSLTAECDQAVVDMLKKMPKWTPGKKDDKEVRVLYTLPVTFRFDDGSEATH